MEKGKKIIIWTVVIFVIANIESMMFFDYHAFWGPFKGLNTWKIANKYDADTEQGEVIFYGSSNFGRWTDMDEDLSAYEV